jgi:cyanophycin synthetase
MPEPAARSRNDVELLELRVLEGPNRFFTRPAVKLEFSGQVPGAAEEVAQAAGRYVLALYEALDLRAPRLTTRRSADELRAVVAFPWRRRTIAGAIAAAASRLALGRTSRRREIAGLRAVALGPLAHVPRPRVPIVAITGTNGKSSTTRLIAHVATRAGLTVGMTNSDGIYVRGELVEAGDWTGFGGAGRVLSEPGIEIAVLETARGGILLRGIGYAANDVAVVTNVSADHLGLQGIDTLDELAEVKAAIVRVTRRDGWAVLNGEDPRVWAMRRQTRAKPYAFALDPEAEALGDALDAGGRAATVEDGWLVLRRTARRRRRLTRVEDLPMALGGLARYNVANALAAAAACDAVGIGPAKIVSGLTSFAVDPAANPGRMNLFERDGRLVLVDFAHNEAGLTGLLEVARGLASGGRVRLALGTAGDRSEEILRNLGAIAGRAVDELVICEKPHYLRGRDLDQMNALFREGAASAGYDRPIEAYPSELASLEALTARAGPGDVVAIMAHAERPQLFAWLEEQGYRLVGAKRVRELVAAGAR